MEEKMPLLPIGSVVELKEEKEPMMIYGRNIVDQENNPFDYLI